MMKYTYEDLSYSKRPLTDDISLVIVSNDLIEAGSKDFIKKTFPYKAGELAAQADNCPVRKIEWLHELVGYLKTQIDGFRIRNTQLSGITAYNGIFRADQKTAEFMAAAGSIAVIASGYTPDTKKILKQNDILTFVSDSHFEINDFLLLRGTGTGLSANTFKSFRIHSDYMEQVDIRYLSDVPEPARIR